MPYAKVSSSEWPSGALVVVQREWNGWQKAMVPYLALQSVHWHRPHGAHRALIHAWVPCTSLVSGEVPHECHESSRPHRLMVCILKSHTAAPVFEALTALANAGAEPLAAPARTAGSGAGIPLS